MEGINLGSVNNKKIAVNMTPQPQTEAPKAQKIQSEMKAEGAKKVGEQAFHDALKQLEKLLGPSNVSISSSLDSKSGLQQVKLVDQNSGKKIAEMPPDGVVKMAENSKQHHIGWLIDRLS